MGYAYFLEVEISEAHDSVFVTGACLFNMATDSERWKHRLRKSDVSNENAAVFATHCIYGQCVVCGLRASSVQKCAGCKAISYCGKICQKSHWKTHKPDCGKN